MGSLFRLLVWAFALYAIWKWMRKLLQNWIQAEPGSRTRLRKEGDLPLSGHMHKDPVCGMYVAEASAFPHHRGGEVYYFCSSECREKFISQGR